MMAFKCDRCGIFSEGRPHEFNAQDFMKRDLCDSCYDSFMVWYCEKGAEALVQRITRMEKIQQAPH